jgi:two-component system NtrC family sensor kinase
MDARSPRRDLPVEAYLTVVAWLAAAVWTALRGPAAVAALAAATGLGLLLLARSRGQWLGLWHLLGGALGAVLGFAGGSVAVEAAALVSLAAAAAEAVTQRRQRALLEEERQGLARQVDRRINEIFSLQELSYILAESLRSERITGQVARYIVRFLGAEGSAVALTDPDGGSLRIAAAEGTLAEFAGQRVTEEPPSLLVRVLTTERIEVTQGTAESLPLAPGHPPGGGAAAPLRAHGFTMGVLAVADRRRGGFSAEDLWLLSTVSTHVAVVLANSRLFELVRQAKEEWETAFNALTEGIAVLDRDGRISRGNAALARLLDVPTQALLGRPFWPTVLGAAQGEDALIGAAAGGERPAPLTLRSEVLNRMVRLTAAPLAEQADHAAVVVLVEDVTEQRALEAQLIQSEKLAAVGQLVSGVAHELNNPLTSIAGLSEFLLERSGLPAAEREHLRVIQEQAGRAGRIVRNLLTFARKGSPGAATVDLNDIVERTAQLVAYELHLRGIALVEERVPGTLPVRGNRDELQQVVLNLVTNAGHAVRDLPPGSLRRVALVTAREGDQAVVRVRDSGPGVDPGLVPQLFTPFFTTKDPGEGTGLGLSLSFRIIEAHGGRLAYQAAPGGGAEFWFALPLTGEALPLAPPPQHPATETAERSALLVDADAGAELVVRALFEPAGYQVEVARTAAEAAPRLGARRWSVIVVDGALSLDGRRLLADQLVEGPGGERPRLLVATADQALAERLKPSGVTVLPRPFLPRDLLLAVGSLVGE